MDGYKECLACDTVKCFTDFHKAKDKPDGYRNTCKICRKTGIMAYRDRPFKKCSSCLTVFPNTNKFFFKYPEGKGKLRKYRSLCKKCHMDKNRFRHLKKRYGITKEEFIQITEEIQKGKCLLCNKKKKLFADHCHKTGKFCGFICDTCNRAIGLFYEEISSLKNAIKYLQKHTKK